MEYKTGYLSFSDLYKLSFDNSPLINMKRFECYMSFIFSIIITIVMYNLHLTNDFTSLNPMLQELFLNIGVALLGMLGFIISGLAIISGTVSNKIAHEINKEGKFQSLLSILFSFYYIGTIIAILILMYFFSYLVISLKLDFQIYVYLFLSFVLSYSLAFAVFYSVSLLGTCINMFVINYNYSKPIDDSSTKELDEYFNDLRINVLTSLMMQKGIISKEDFIIELKNRINEDCPERIKDNLYCKICKYYSIF